MEACSYRVQNNNNQLCLSDCQFFHDSRYENLKINLLDADNFCNKQNNNGAAVFS
jgi:hypothetical protein